MGVRDDNGGGSEADQRLADQAGGDVERTRRDAMVRLAKYTAPAMLAMLLNDKAMAAS